MAKQECPKCLGEGHVANDDEMSPWKYWRDLPPGSDLAVRLGLVYPVRCPRCEGTGYIKLDDSPMIGGKS